MNDHPVEGVNFVKPTAADLGYAPEDQPQANTDRELWRDPGSSDSEAYQDRVYVTADDRLGIVVAGYGQERTLYQWASLDKQADETTKAEALPVEETYLRNNLVAQLLASSPGLPAAEIIRMAQQLERYISTGQLVSDAAKIATPRTKGLQGRPESFPVTETETP